MVFFENWRLMPMAAPGDSEERDSPIVSDLASRRIDIFGRIDRNATLHVQAILDKFRRTGKNKKVTVAVNTRGGEALQGLAIYDLIRSSGLEVVTIVLGEVASSGLAIALAGRERRMHRNAIFHFHRTGMEFDKPRKAIERHDSDIEIAQIEVVDALFDRITLANTKMSLCQLRNLERREAYVTAPEALKLGLIHKII
jgi:ATP-dependent protease ClpP protease subunit